MDIAHENSARSWTAHAVIRLPRPTDLFKYRVISTISFTFLLPRGKENQFVERMLISVLRTLCQNPFNVEIVLQWFSFLCFQLDQRKTVSLFSPLIQGIRSQLILIVLVRPQRVYFLAFFFLQGLQTFCTDFRLASRWVQSS